MEKPKVFWDIRVGKSCKTYGCQAINSAKAQEANIRRQAIAKGVEIKQNVGAVAICIECPGIQGVNGDGMRLRCRAKLTNSAVYNTQHQVIGKVSPH